jgi:hypothetical protein
VGNIYERYKLSELICQKLIDKFTELKDPTAFLEDKSNSGETGGGGGGGQSSGKMFIFSLSEQLTRALGRNLELESKLKAAHLELEQNRLERENSLRQRLQESAGDQELAFAKKRIEALENEIDQLNEKLAVNQNEKNTTTTKG